MKVRILLTIAAAALITPFVHAGSLPSPTPDTGSTVGVFALGVLVLAALRRKLVK